TFTQPDRSLPLNSSIGLAGCSAGAADSRATANRARIVRPTRRQADCRNAYMEAPQGKVRMPVLPITVCRGGSKVKAGVQRRGVFPRPQKSLQWRGTNLDERFRR